MSPRHEVRWLFIGKCYKMCCFFTLTAAVFSHSFALCMRTTIQYNNYKHVVKIMNESAQAQRGDDDTSRSTLNLKIFAVNKSPFPRSITFSCLKISNVNCSQKVRKLFSIKYICIIYYSVGIKLINAKLRCSSLK